MHFVILFYLKGPSLVKYGMLWFDDFYYKTKFLWINYPILRIFSILPPWNIILYIKVWPGCNKGNGCDVAIKYLVNISESDSWTRKLSDDEGKIIGKWIYKSVRVIKDLPLGALLLLKLQYRTGKNAIKLSINSNKPGFGFYCLFHAKLAAQPYQGLTHS